MILRPAFASQRKQRGFIINPFAFGSSAPATPTPTFSNVKLLLHLDAKPFVDSSTNKRAVSHYKNPTLNTSTQKYGAGCLTTSSTTGLQIPQSADFTFGTGAWMISAWIKVASGVSASIFDCRVNPGTDNTGVVFAVTSSLAVFAQVNGTNYGTTSPAVKVPENTWSFVAASYDGTTLRTFVDGVLATATTVSLNVTNSGFCAVGNAYPGMSTGVSSNIDDLCVVKGEAVFTAAFTPPSAAQPDTGIVIEAAPAGTYANVVGLLHFESGLTDNSPSPRTYTARGSAAVSSAQAKWGSQSLSLNGSTQWIDTPANAVWDFGTGDWTLEGWVRPTNRTNNNTLWSTYNNPTDGWSFYLTADTGVPRFNRQGTVFDAWSACANNTWTHIACCKISGVLYMYVDGELQNIVADSINYNSSTDAFIGSLRADGISSFLFNGYIDDARAVKGEGVYPRSFIVPAGAFADS